MIIGDSGSGKTQLISRFITGKSEVTQPTNTISLHTCKVQVKEGITVKAHLIDNPGSPVFFNVIKSHWSNSHGALVVYDISNYSSFVSVRAWIQNYKTYCSMGDRSVVMICGNKCHKTNREVKTEEGEKLALEYGCFFFETSAINNVNVTAMFHNLISTAFDALPPALKMTVGDQGHNSLPRSGVSSPASTIPMIQTPKEYFHSADMLWKAPQHEVSMEDKPASSSLWDRTVDLLDWLIPESPSDEECSEEEFVAPLPRQPTVKRPFAPRTTSLMPAQRMLTRKKTVSKEDEFSTKSLVDFLTQQPPLQTMLDESALKRDSGKYFATNPNDLPIDMIKINE
jgi:small GTP-binding protein